MKQAKKLNKKFIEENTHTTIQSQFVNIYKVGVHLSNKAPKQMAAQQGTRKNTPDEHTIAIHGRATNQTTTFTQGNM